MKNVETLISYSLSLPCQGEPQLGFSQPSKIAIFHFSPIIPSPNTSRQFRTSFLIKDWFGTVRTYPVRIFSLIAKIRIIPNFLFYDCLTSRYPRARTRHCVQNLFHRRQKNHLRIRAPRALRHRLRRHPRRSVKLSPHHYRHRQPERWGFFPTHRRIPRKILRRRKNRR